ncbi:putative integral membrane protein [Streptomyces sp. B3I7]|uniref:hypothetical protein n=1 Tax=Streptomyces sp. B3I7 TaxID=3042269 RepID=UPI0027806717|nr:putative integral membrane protein [Streptomyces sp. B3I7]
MTRAHTDRAHMDRAHADKVHTDGSYSSRPAVRRLLPFAVITAIALVFIFENRSNVEIRLLVPLVTMPLWGALLIAWALGVLACVFTVRRRSHRHSR